jgi:hypothetical protein
VLLSVFAARAVCQVKCSVVSLCSSLLCLVMASFDAFNAAALDRSSQGGGWR